MGLPKMGLVATSTALCATRPGGRIRMRLRPARRPSLGQTHAGAAGEPSFPTGLPDGEKVTFTLQPNWQPEPSLDTAGETCYDCSPAMVVRDDEGFKNKVACTTPTVATPTASGAANSTTTPIDELPRIAQWGAARRPCKIRIPMVRLTCAGATKART